MLAATIIGSWAGRQDGQAGRKEGGGENEAAATSAASNTATATFSVPVAGAVVEARLQFQWKISPLPPFLLKVTAE